MKKDKYDISTLNSTVEMFKYFFVKFVVFGKNLPVFFCSCWLDGGLTIFFGESFIGEDDCFVFLTLLVYLLMLIE